MKQKTHLTTQMVVFACASCNSRFEILSTLKTKESSIDVCANCHPFYQGTSLGQQVRGRVEKFNKKLTSKTDSKVETKKKEQPKSNKKIIKSLSSL